MAVVNYAHRGASEYYPENTLRSFYAGLEMRADGIETDIQCTSDGVLVLFHDDTVKRILGKSGSIKDYTYAQLLEMDFGIFKGERFVNERIVTLDDFLHYFGCKDLTIALEIKQSGIEAQILESIAKHGCRDKVIITSFIWESVAATRALDADIATGYLTDTITAEKLDMMERINVGQICPRVDLVDETSMALAVDRGFSVRFWGVASDVSLMRRALELGGDGMTINAPDKLTEALGR